jgi:hypothetical protein
LRRALPVGQGLFDFLKSFGSLLPLPAGNIRLNCAGTIDHDDEPPVKNARKESRDQSQGNTGALEQRSTEPR